MEDMPKGCVSIIEEEIYFKQPTRMAIELRKVI